MTTESDKEISDLKNEIMNFLKDHKDEILDVASRAWTIRMGKKGFRTLSIKSMKALQDIEDPRALLVGRYRCGSAVYFQGDGGLRPESFSGMISPFSAFSENAEEQINALLRRAGELSETSFFSPNLWYFRENIGGDIDERDGRDGSWGGQAMFFEKSGIKYLSFSDQILSEMGIFSVMSGMFFEKDRLGQADLGHNKKKEEFDLEKIRYVDCEALALRMPFQEAFSWGKISDLREQSKGDWTPLTVGKYTVYVAFDHDGLADRLNLKKYDIDSREGRSPELLKSFHDATYPNIRRIPFSCYEDQKDGSRAEVELSFLVTSSKEFAEVMNMMLSEQSALVDETLEQATANHLVLEPNSAPK